MARSASFCAEIYAQNHFFVRLGHYFIHIFFFEKIFCVFFNKPIDNSFLFK